MAACCFGHLVCSLCLIAVSESSLSLFVPFSSFVNGRSIG